jgi:hypothetical protein
MNKAVRSFLNPLPFLLCGVLLANPLANAQPGGNPQGTNPQGSTGQGMNPQGSGTQGGGTQGSTNQVPAQQMPLHHIHISMMDHGLKMVAQGSTMEMLSEMHMDPKVKHDIDKITLQHGRDMFNEGKDMIQKSMQGQAMQKLHEQGGQTGETMKYTHDLGTAMLNVVNILESMNLNAPNEQAMNLHHIHIALNHALVMAANGANLVMLGQMGMASNVDDVSIRHGQKMLSDARDIVKKVTQSDSYKSLMSNEATKRQARTEDLVNADNKVIDMLEKMPGAPQTK